MRKSGRLTTPTPRPRLLTLLVVALLVALVLGCGPEPADPQIQASAAAPLDQTPAPTPSSTPPSPSATPRPTERAATESVTPTAIPAPAPTPTARPASRSEGVASPDQRAQAERVHAELPTRDLVELAVRLRGAEIGELDAGIATPLSVGDRRDFWLSDLGDGSATAISATLRIVSENAYWFVDDGVSVDMAGLEEGARLFERQVRPAVVAAFGDIRNPGIDGDPRLMVLHSRLDGAAGYFGSKDAYPTEVHPHSNEGEIIYIDVEFLKPGSDLYMSVLAHEFQHAIHSNQDIGEDTWVNEGLSELATEVAGYETNSPGVFLPRPQTQLNYWPESSSGGVIAHYGASALFFRYLAQRVGGTANLKDLMTERLDGIAGVDAFLRGRGLSFEGVFADWVAANYLDAEDERYGYLGSEVKIRRARPLGEGGGREMSLPQFSARYHSLRTGAAAGALRFRGNKDTRQVETDCVSDSGCWWSGRGDSINTKLTREFDLAGLDSATLEYVVWHDIEDGWDYGYVEVSDDGGRSWTILNGRHTSDSDVSGNAYGPGYTGRSRDWKRESIDLTPFVGGPVLVRFEYVTDDAVYRDGFMVADVSVAELDGDGGPGGWDADGFALARDALPQRFIVQVVVTDANGEYDVSRLDLDDRNFGEMTLEGLDAPDIDVVAIVSPVTPDTRHGASYTLEFLPRTP